MRRAYSTSDVAAISGATPGQLGYWDATGLLCPSLHRPATDGGSMRLYGFEDLLELRVLLALRRQGLPLQRIRRGLTYLRFRRPDVARPLRELVLETDGRTMFALVGPDEVTDALVPGQQVCRVALGPIYEELSSCGSLGPTAGPNIGKAGAA